MPGMIANFVKSREDYVRMEFDRRTFPLPVSRATLVTVNGVRRDAWVTRSDTGPWRRLTIRMPKYNVTALFPPYVIDAVARGDAEFVDAIYTETAR